MMDNTNWQTKHRETIDEFLKHLNGSSDDFILKGGTALMTCYGLDRFSEDIDLDGTKKTIGSIVDDFCRKKEYSYRIAKDTDTVKRYMINYGNEGRPLKVEVSFRKRVIDPNEVDKIQGINVYKINSLCAMKANAYINRDKIRDLYDLAFICNNFWEQLLTYIKSMVRETVSYKGIEQFDYLIKDQTDELINNSKLAEDFLTMYDRLDLLADEKELDILNNTIQHNKQPMRMNDWKEAVEFERANNSNNSQAEKLKKNERNTNEER